MFAGAEPEVPEFVDDFETKPGPLLAVHKFGYEDDDYTIRCLENKEANYCSTSYYLMAKD